MRTILNANWIMKDGNNTYLCAVPCSLYKVLLDNNAIPDPYYGVSKTDTPYHTKQVTDCDSLMNRRTYNEKHIGKVLLRQYHTM